MSSRVSELAEAVLRLLSARRETIATAESLTGGLLCSTLVDVPGASASVRGGVVAYAADVKAGVLGVDEALLTARGTVDADVALQMAGGVRERLASTWGVATTGVAGPDPAEGKPVGTVLVAVYGPDVCEVRQLELSGGRADIRSKAVVDALSLLLATLEEQSTQDAG